MTSTSLPSRTSVLEKLVHCWQPMHETEIIAVEQSYGRIAAQTLYSINTLPLVRSSMSDGIAVNASHFENGMPDTSIWVKDIDYARADTGDDFDDRFNAIIAIEEVSFNSNGGLTLSEHITSLAPGNKVRKSGDQVTQGDLLIQAYMPIRAIDISLLQMGGYQTVSVIKKPVVTFIPTGTELIAPGSAPKRGQNIDTNSIMAQHMLIEMGATPVCEPIVKDNMDQLEAILEKALQLSDIVVINGGSSKGAEDFNAQLLKQKGTVLCHGVAAAPGKPICIAIIQDKLVINLPGPVVAAFWGLDWCVRTAVCHYLKIPMLQRPTVKAILTSDITTPSHMEIFCRVHLQKNTLGQYEAIPLSFDQRTLMTGANGAFVSKQGESFYPQGSEVDIELLRGIEFIV